MAQLSDVLLQGLRSAQPLATAVAAGTLYYVTDEGVTEQSDATVWSAYSGTSSGAGLLLLATQTLTNAQIKALPTTPVTIVLAPGANLKITPIAYSLKSDTAAGAYTNIDPTYRDIHLELNGIYVGYGPVDDSTTTPALTRVTDMLGAAGTVVFAGLGPALAGVPVAGSAGYVQPSELPAPSVVVNRALTIKIENNGAGNLTGGNAANSLKVNVYYVVDDLS